MIWFLAGSETICFILSYRIQPNTYPQCQMDLALAIMHVRAHARQYGIDENRILVVGASAGGALCASTAMLHEELKTEIFCAHPELEKLYGRISARPDGVGLLYPVISFTSEYHEEAVAVIQAETRIFRKNCR